MVTLEETTKMESEVKKMKIKGDITGTIVVDSRRAGGYCRPGYENDKHTEAGNEF